MSKKHFIKLAANFKNQIEGIRSMSLADQDKAARLGTVFTTVQGVVDVCADANPNFNRARFLTACGM